MIGFAMCGSFCTHKKALSVMSSLAEHGYDILSILSPAAAATDTRFGRADELMMRAESICGKPPVLTIRDAEPLGPKTPLDLLLICPCTGNTLAKLASGITDTPVTMAAKAHMRNGRPTVIALASNDGMSANLKNLATLLEKKNVFFVPMLQDDPQNKPHSLVCDFSLAEDTVSAALSGRQLRPLFLS